MWEAAAAAAADWAAARPGIFRYGGSGLLASADMFCGTIGCGRMGPVGRCGGGCCGCCGVGCCGGCGGGCAASAELAELLPVLVVAVVGVLLPVVVAAPGALRIGVLALETPDDGGVLGGWCR